MDAVRLARTMAVIRRALLGIVAFGIGGLSTELLLTGHYEDTNQMIPLVLSALALVVVGWVAVAPGVVAIRALQLTMLSYAGAGITGMTLHFQANAEFQREIDPEIAPRDLFWKVVEATAPPALAPGVMVQLGLLGLVSTYRHPGLGEPDLVSPRPGRPPAEES